MESVMGAGILHTVGMSGIYGVSDQFQFSTRQWYLWCALHLNVWLFKHTAVDLPMSVDSVNVRILEPHGDVAQTQPLACASIPLVVGLFCLFMITLLLG